MPVTTKCEAPVATSITPSGESNEYLLPEDSHACLNLLQSLVGGPLQALPLPGRRYMLINDEGAMVPHQPNPIATMLAQEAQSIHRDDYIAGTAVIVPAKVLE